MKYNKGYFTLNLVVGILILGIISVAGVGYVEYKKRQKDAISFDNSDAVLVNKDNINEKENLEPSVKNQIITEKINTDTQSSGSKIADKIISPVASTSPVITSEIKISTELKKFLPDDNIENLSTTGDFQYINDPKEFESIKLSVLPLELVHTEYFGRPYTDMSTDVFIFNFVDTNTGMPTLLQNLGLQLSDLQSEDSQIIFGEKIERFEAEKSLRSVLSVYVWEHKNFVVIVGPTASETVVGLIFKNIISKVK